MNKNYKKLNKKIANIIDKHSMHSNNGLFSDVVGSEFLNIAIHLSNLEKAARRGVIEKWGELSFIREAIINIKLISKNLTQNSYISDEKQKAKYKPLIDAVLKQASEFEQTIKANNSIDTSIEAAIVNKIVNEMKEIPSKEESDYENYHNRISSKEIVFVDYIEGVFLKNHVLDMERLNKTAQALTTAPQYEQELVSEQEKAATLYDSFAQKVERDCKALTKLSNKFFNNKPNENVEPPAEKGEESPQAEL